MAVGTQVADALSAPSPHWCVGADRFLAHVSLALVLVAGVQVRHDVVVGPRILSVPPRLVGLTSDIEAQVDRRSSDDTSTEDDVANCCCVVRSCAVAPNLAYVRDGLAPVCGDRRCHRWCWCYVDAQVGRGRFRRSRCRLEAAKCVTASDVHDLL